MKNFLSSTTLVLLIASSLAIGCGDDDAAVDAAVDAAPDTATPDTGTEDADTPDTNTEDTGPADTGTEDSGGGDDSGTAGMCPAGACDLLENGCTEDGAACYLTADGPTCAAAGAVAEGEACTNANDCLEGHICISEGAGQPSLCRRTCCEGDNSSCPTPSHLCFGIRDAEGAGFCRAPDGCDIVAQTGCEGDLACLIASADGSTRCGVNEGTGVQGETCGGDSEVSCADGFICVGTCQRACTIGDEEGCEGDLVCGGITDFPETLGSCRMPG